MEPSTRVPDVLAELQSGRRDTLDRIMPIVYEHLRIIARHHPGKRLEATIFLATRRTPFRR